MLKNLYEAGVRFPRGVEEAASKSSVLGAKFANKIYDFYGQIRKGQILHMPTDTNIHADFSQGRIFGEENVVFMGDFLKDAAAVSEKTVEIIAGKRYEGTSVSSRFKLSGKMTDGSRAYTKYLDANGTSEIEKGAEIYCKRVVYFEPSEFKGKVHTEKCSQELRDRYENIKLIKKGVYDKLAEEQTAIIGKK